MEKVIMKILACCMIAVLLICNLQMPVAATVTNHFMAQGMAGSGENVTTQKRDADSTEADLAEELSTQDTEESSQDTTENLTENTEEASTQDTESTEGSNDTEENTESEETEDIELEELPVEGDDAFLYEIKASASFPNHKVTMPDLTSQYFWTQKGSEHVSEAEASHLIVLNNEKEVSQYMQEQYEEGERYNFVPRITKDTQISVGGGESGRVSVDTVKASDIQTFGEVYVLANRIVDTAFDLDQCTTAPYAIYSNVGTWYDKTNNKMHQVDMKITVTNYVYPDESIRKTLRVPYKAPYAAFVRKSIGLVVMGTDSVETKMEFFYHGTEEPVEGIRGMIQFIDIDAQQGVDLGTGFENMILFNTDKTHMRYSALGVLEPSIGYTCSGTAEAFDYRDVNTTAIGIFSEPTVNCVWTVARCDNKDTGGSALYQEAGGYQVPQDKSAQDSNNCYSTIRSSGFLGIDTDVAMISLPPQIQKAVYSGEISADKSATEDKELTLEEREKPFTYVLSAASALPSDLEKAYYTKYNIEDTIPALLEVNDVKVFAGVNEGDNITFEEVTDSFDVTVQEQEDYQTKVEVKAKEDVLKTLAFYGANYYVNIGVRVRSDEELAKRSLSINDWYQTDGVYAVQNTGKLHVKSSMDTVTDLDSDEVVTKVPMYLAIQKVDKASKKPVANVEFGLFGGSSSEHRADSTPIATAKTNEEGIAAFEQLTFYQEQYGDGPYYVKEIKVPDIYKNVWDDTVMTSWSFEIPTLKNAELLKSASNQVAKKAVLENENNILEENELKVIKKNTETKAVLSGAEYQLMQWSEEKQKYVDYMTLKEQNQDGEVYYSNEKPVTNTMDNLGNYKIVESRAPEGCILTGEEWTFSFHTKNKKTLTFTSSLTKNTQEGFLIYENPLQKGRLDILKKDEEGNALEGVEFQVTAAEDIYAPWDKANQTKDAKPLVKKGTVVGEVKTDEEGKARLEQLYIGKYLVVETKSPAGYRKETEPYEVNFEYDKDANLKEVTYQLDVVNELMKPELNVAKLADRTKDAKGEIPTLNEKNGRYESERIAGDYQAEEQVQYTITVTNSGNTTIHNIHVTDDMDYEDKEGRKLSDYIEKETARFILPEQGIFTSKRGGAIQGSLSEENKLELLLDSLNAGDSVDVTITAKVKKDAKKAEHLENDVTVRGYYYDIEDENPGEEKEVEKGQKKDEDFINIVEKPEEPTTEEPTTEEPTEDPTTEEPTTEKPNEEKTTEKRRKTTESKETTKKYNTTSNRAPKTGDQNPVMIYLILCAAGVAGISMTLHIRKRRMK